jgi:hypothetical protein
MSYVIVAKGTGLIVTDGPNKTVHTKLLVPPMPLVLVFATKQVGQW